MADSSGSLDRVIIRQLHQVKLQLILFFLVELFGRMLKFVSKMPRKGILKFFYFVTKLVLFFLAVIAFFVGFRVIFDGPFEPACSPKTNIVFLKTHKCAGSTIQNILLRYGQFHNLMFVFPKKTNYLGHPYPFHKDMLPEPRLPSYNIFTHHTRFNYQEIQSVMEKNSIYITIVRDPIEVFESMYSYYNLQNNFKVNLHKLTSKIPYMKRDQLHRRYAEKFGSNQMMFDLGANPKIFCNETLIKQYINKLDSWFDLVLIADRIDESLVLLRHQLCWDLDDVVAFKLNARSPKFKKSLNKKEKYVLRQLNHADVLLYNHFVQRFEKAIDSIGRDRVELETQELRNRTQELYNLCVMREQLGHRNKPKYHWSGKVMLLLPNTHKNDICKWMTMEELPYTDILREKQEKLIGAVPTSACFIDKP